MTEGLNYLVSDVDAVKLGMELILSGLKNKYGLELDENFTDTPDRVSRLYDEIFSGIKDTQKQISKILNSAFPTGYDQMILLKDIEVFSMCPHHFLPVRYLISVAYIPSEGGRVLGISKLARLVEILAKRPVLQEQLTEDITKNLLSLNIKGAACVVKGVHYCMVMRGVKQSNAITITSSLKGAFLSKLEARQEFLELIR